MTLVKNITVLSMLLLVACSPGKICITESVVNGIPIAYHIDTQYRYCSAAWAQSLRYNDNHIIQSSRIVEQLENNKEEMNKAYTKVKELEKRTKIYKVECGLVEQ